MDSYLNPFQMQRNLLITIILAISGSLVGQTADQSAPEGMVYIPGGTSMMGSNSHQGIAAPEHRVNLTPFYMDICEVTNRQYYEFCKQTGYKFPEFWGMEIYKSGMDFPDHPVVGVSQFDASEYAEWAGKRLPTEAEWEYAARGGLEQISYPFGEEADHSHARYKHPQADKGPVKTGTYASNGYGLFDMSGNVWEWVSDWFSESYYQESEEKDPIGPPGGTFKVLRGGGWHSGGGCISVHRRNALPQQWCDMAGGFRCVKELD